MTRHTKNRNVTLLVQYKQVIKFNVGQYRVLISHMRGLSPILRKRENIYIYVCMYVCMYVYKQRSCI